MCSKDAREVVSGGLVAVIRDMHLSAARTYLKKEKKKLSHFCFNDYKNVETQLTITVTRQLLTKKKSPAPSESTIDV